MYCYVHPDRDPVGTCTACGRPICRECAVEMQNKLVCRECLSLGKVALPVAVPQAYGGQGLKSKSTALILEILPGLFGFLGFGWIYAGNTTTGVIWLICFFVWDIIAGVLAAFTVAISLCFTLPVNLILLAISAFTLNNYVKNHPELFNP
jgi:hypothetical protein